LHFCLKRFLKKYYLFSKLSFFPEMKRIKGKD